MKVRKLEVASGTNHTVRPRTRFMLWSVFLVLFLSGLAASSFAAAPSSTSLPALAAVAPGPVEPSQVSAPAEAATCYGDSAPNAGETVFGQYYSCDPSVPQELAQVSPDQSSTPIVCAPTTDESCFAKYTKNPSGLLPAWRWRDNVGLYSNMTGIEGIFATLFSFLASVLFSISQLFWWALLEVCQWVLTDTLVQKAGTGMNKGFSVFTDLLNASGIFLILGAIGLFILVRQLLRGRLVKVLGMVLAFIIPIGVLQGLAVQAQKVPSNVPAPAWAASDLPTGSPAWFAVSGVNLVEGFTSWFTSGFGRLSIISGSMQIQQASAVDPSCAAYVAALYDQYYAYSSSPISSMRTGAQEEYYRQMQAFDNSSQAMALRETDPLSYYAAREKHATKVQAELQLTFTPPSDTDWAARMSSRSAAEKLADARQYRVATVSQLWHRAFLGSWTAAQFGSQEAGAKMYCHMLESNAGTPIDEQAAIAAVANRYSYSIGYGGQPTKSPGYEGVSIAVFEKGRDKEQREQRILAWAACRRAETQPGVWEWKAEPGWKALGNDHGVNDDICKRYFTDSRTTSESVRGTVASLVEGAAAGTITVAAGPVGAAWDSVMGLVPLDLGEHFTVSALAGWVGDLLGDSIEAGSIDRNGMIKPLVFDDLKSIERAVNDAALISVNEFGQEACTSDQAACADAAQAAFDSAEKTGEMLSAFKGDNSTQRLTFSILALIVSVIYVYAIGFVALGTFFAKVGLVIMVMLLPAVLVLLAAPSSSGESGGSRMGKKMLRLTGGFILSHGMLSFVLGLLLSVILLFESFIGGDGGSFIHALIPLVSLFLVRQLLKIAGLGDLTSMQGALGMPLSAALRAGGKDLQSMGMNKFNSLTGGEKWDPKTNTMRPRGLSRADAFAKRTAKAAVARPTKWAGRKASDRLGLPEAKRMLVGRRDADGNLVEHGLAHRMKNFAGLFRMGAEVATAVAPGLRRLGSSDMGKKFSSFANKSKKVRKLVAADKEMQRQVRQNRDQWRNVVGANSDGRHKLRTQYALEHIKERNALELALRDEHGNVLRDASGKPIYGYRHTESVKTRLGGDLTDSDGRTVYALEGAATGKRITTGHLDRIGALEQQKKADGTLITGAGGAPVYGWCYNDGEGSRVLDWDEYQALSPAQKRNCRNVYDKDSMKRGVRYLHDADAGSSILSKEQVDALSPGARAIALTRPVTDPGRGFLTDDEMEAVSRAYAERYQFRPGQFVVSVLGEPVLAPVMGDAMGNNRLLVTKNAEASRELAAQYRYQYLPNDQKRRPDGFTDDQYSAYLKLMDEYLGAYAPDGSRTDLVYELTGHAWDSEIGKREITAAIENRDGALSSYRPEIPPDVLASMKAAASQFSPRAEQATIYKDIATARYETLSEAQVELTYHRGVANEGIVELDSYGTQLRALSPKLKAVQDNLRNLAVSRSRHTEAGTDLADMDRMIKDIEDEIDRLSRSSSAADRTAMVSRLSDLASARTSRDSKKTELDALDAAVAKLAASEADWQREEREYAATMESIQQNVTRVTEVVFDSSKRAEELDKQMEFAFKAFRRDKGKEDWSKVDDMIDDWIKGHNNRWAADGRDIRALEMTLQKAIDSGEPTHARLAYEELASVLNSIGRRASRESATGSAYHGYIINDLAKLEGNLRHTVETNPEFIPWTKRNYMTGEYSDAR